MCDENNECGQQLTEVRHAEPCQMVPGYQQTSTGATNLVHITTKLPQLCSPSSSLSNEPNSTSLVPFILKLPYLAVLFILQPTQLLEVRNI